MEEQLLELHETFGYCIVVERTPENNAVKVSYPNKIIFGDSENVSIMYEIHNEYDICSIYRYSSESLHIPDIIEVPAYAARLAVIADMIFMCVSFDISSNLVVNYDATGNRVDSNIETFDILDPPIEVENKTKEGKLKSIFKRMLSGKGDCSQSAMTYNVEEGYRLLVDIFNTGGF